MLDIAAVGQGGGTGRILGLGKTHFDHPWVKRPCGIMGERGLPAKQLRRHPFQSPASGGGYVWC